MRCNYSAACRVGCKASRRATWSIRSLPSSWRSSFAKPAKLIIRRISRRTAPTPSGPSGTRTTCGRGSARSWTRTSPEAGSSICLSWSQTSNPSTRRAPAGPSTMPSSLSLDTHKFAHGVVKVRLAFSARRGKFEGDAASRALLTEGSERLRFFCRACENRASSLQGGKGEPA
jgi:hypothetical protein